MKLKTRATGQFHKAQAQHDSVYLTEEAAQYLAQAGIKLVGIDSLSLEQYGSQGLPAHRALLSAGVVIVEGMFLHRDELAGRWDLSVFLDVPFAETARRMAARDGSVPDPEHPSMRRYVEGQRRYLAGCDPRQRATLVVDNTEPRAPRFALE